MVEPTKKNQEIENLLTKVSGASRVGAIKTDRCISPPIGCGKSAKEFTDDISKKEFAISGLCQDCQNKLFGGPEDI